MREHGPQGVDMRLDASAGLRFEIASGRHLFRFEAGLHEGAQIEARVGAPGCVLLEDLRGVLQRQRVDEAFAVLEGPLHLDPLEQAGIQLRRRRRRRDVGGTRRAGQQPEQQPPDQNS
jgi:hypothetical protein